MQLPLDALEEVFAVAQRGERFLNDGKRAVEVAAHGDEILLRQRDESTFAGGRVGL